MQSSTIYALSTPPGKSAVAVIRLSGPGVMRCFNTLVPEGKLTPRQARVAVLRNPHTGHTIDKALVLFFEGPRSFTGEDCLEFHTHGSGAVVRELLAVLADIPGLRLAEPGEFTRRAWLNEKMDMAEAEALRDLIEAETAAQKDKALRNMSGAVQAAVGQWREDIIEGLSFLEASIDFVDEDDINESTVALAVPPLERALASMTAAAGEAEAGVRLAAGLQVALVGVPNAGKSSLLNYLAKREVAIVTNVPGTTRDVLEVTADLGGLPVVLRDTAGVRETSDVVESIGVARAKDAIRQADLVVLFVNEGSEDELAALEEACAGRQGEAILRVHGKADVSSPRSQALPISIKTGEGMPAFLDVLGESARGLLNPEALIGSERQRVALAYACQDLGLALKLLHDEAGSADLAAEHVHLAERALQRLIGRIDVEDVLDRIFSSFCIGK